jgi:hypothetical protein
MNNTRLWAIFLEKLGGLVRGIGKLLIETGQELRRTADGEKVSLETAIQKLSGGGDRKN